MRLLAATAVILAAVLLLPGCSRTSSSSAHDSAGCLYRVVFVALQQLPGIQARCPTWLPDDVRPTYINATQASGYVVEFETLRQHPYRHVVLLLEQGDPPGRQLGEAVVGSRRAAIYFEPSLASGPAGLHSGHYVIDVLGGAYQRGSYWVSVHEIPQRSRQWNVQRALRIARSLRSIPS